MSPSELAPTVVVGCGALVRELRALDAQLAGAEFRFLPAPLHNRPERIVGEVRDAIHASLAAASDAGSEPPRFVIGYGDCGTGGGLDRLLDELHAEGLSAARLPGAHCYAFFSGLDAFDEMMEEELGTFFLTDYLARNFDTLIWRPYRLDTHPELRNALFGAYRRVVHLTQTEDPTTRARLHELAADAAGRLGLNLETRTTGLSPLRHALEHDVLVSISGPSRSPSEDSEPCPAAHS